MGYQGLQERLGTPKSQEESGFSPKPRVEDSVGRNQCSGHRQDSVTKGRGTRAPARPAHLPSGVSGCQIWLFDLAGEGGLR